MRLITTYFMVVFAMLSLGDAYAKTLYFVCSGTFVKHIDKGKKTETFTIPSYSISIDADKNEISQNDGFINCRCLYRKKDVKLEFIGRAGGRRIVGYFDMISGELVVSAYHPNARSKSEWDGLINSTCRRKL